MCWCRAYFGLAQKSQIERLVRKFFGSAEVVKYFVDNVPDQTLSMASLQVHANIFVALTTDRSVGLPDPM